MVLPWRTPERIVDLVGFDLHAAASPIALLPPPELTVMKSEVDRKTGGQARDERDQCFAVRLMRQFRNGS